MPDRTGPNTAAGKLIVSRNAVSHGLHAADIVVRSESNDEWEAFHDGIVENVQPDGPLEAELAARIAELLWRLRRVARAERQMIRLGQAMDDFRQLERQRIQEAKNRGIEPTHFYETPAVPASEVTFVPPPPRLLADDLDAAKVMRIEAHLNRQLLHALHELEALQERRKGNRTPLTRVDVQHSLPKQ